MNKYNKIFCLFEQSGTFKKEFIKLGYNAIDIDIDNKFNETDIKIDIFNEIEKADKNERSIFDEIRNNDLIIAFFPCIRFERQIGLFFRGDQSEMKNMSDLKKIELVERYKKERDLHYNRFMQLYKICIVRNIKCIIENPYHEDHYLIKYFPIKPKLIDRDRRKDGDNYKKPTMYYFINIEPKINIQDYMIRQIDIFTINEQPKGIIRSLINKDYAKQFILKYIL